MQSIAFLTGGVFLLLLFAVGRRKPTTPHCRRCRYETGEHELRTCPECGLDLAKPKAIRSTFRKRSRLVLLAGLVCFGVAAVAPVRYVVDTWPKHQPLIWLRYDMGSEDRVLVAAAIKEVQDRWANERITTDQFHRTLEPEYRRLFVLPDDQWTNADSELMTLLFWANTLPPAVVMRSRCRKNN